MEQNGINMENVQTLIQRLQSLAGENAAPSSLLLVCQHLIKELQQPAIPAAITRHAVSVVIPAAMVHPAEAPVTMEARETKVPGPMTKAESTFPAKPEVILALAPDEEEDGEKMIDIKNDAQPALPEKLHSFIYGQASAFSSIDVPTEAPTLVQITSENGTIRHELNDELKRNDTELGQALQSTPIEDLNAAIGINDRYLFISDLFRGDENMYERSILTLNRFHDYSQAHAWAERELHVKIGWDESNTVTQQFEQLIRRRFMRKNE